MPHPSHYQMLNDGGWRNRPHFQHAHGLKMYRMDDSKEGNRILDEYIRHSYNNDGEYNPGYGISDSSSSSNPESDSESDSLDGKEAQRPQHPDEPKLEERLSTLRSTTTDEHSDDHRAHNEGKYKRFDEEQKQYKGRHYRGNDEHRNDVRPTDKGYDAGAGRKLGQPQVRKEPGKRLNHLRYLNDHSGSVQASSGSKGQREGYSGRDQNRPGGYHCSRNGNEYVHYQEPGPRVPEAQAYSGASQSQARNYHDHNHLIY
ncbi:hypothetical protein D9757_006860 [Collybiopsis confluens]|uniref:Uncharacterized protein n=1 Tax=Collybiopsis confluens TaxID=2823264 RepID=A0A8H5HPM8_9AGAR|nr:hypothetical protein D9757_006860 [Collybiopsis confluens]